MNEKSNKISLSKFSIKFKVILNLIIFFVILFAIAGILTLISENLSFYFGIDTVIFPGVHWSYNAFFIFMVSILITPIAVAYINNELAKLKDALR